MVNKFFITYNYKNTHLNILQTDHDPRNPAYIAAAGPLAQTAPDFWQMVWEQGSVVMVMLTRLTENGQQLCHRYWPEEGSELYHIYEVFMYISFLCLIIHSSAALSSARCLTRMWRTECVDIMCDSILFALTYYTV